MAADRPEARSAATIAELAVRAARAEMERDAALKRAELAERSLRAVMSKDEAAMLDTLHIMGIPARDLAELYEVEAAHRRREAQSHG